MVFQLVNFGSSRLHSRRIKVQEPGSDRPRRLERSFGGLPRAVIDPPVIPLAIDGRGLIIYLT